MICLKAGWSQVGLSPQATGRGLKLLHGRFRLDIKRNFFTGWVIKHWNALPREVPRAVVVSQSLEMFKGKLNNDTVVIGLRLDLI